MNSDHRRELAAEVREAVPNAPGVYAFLDAHGRLQYIGKSVNLRQRVLSYFQQDPFTGESHIGQLITNVRSFAWWETRSELLALLLEDVLIKEHLPPLNTRQRECEENRYLELTDDDYPTLLVVEHLPDFGTREVFGPFKDKHFAGLVQDILHETLGVRTCRESAPAAKCLDYDLGRCSGPCREAVGPHDYRELVRLTRDFLQGEPIVVLERLEEKRDRAANGNRFEEAARLRDAVETCRRFGAHQRFANEFTAGECRFRCTQDDVEYVFAKGAMVEPRVVVVARGRSERLIDESPDSFHPETAGRRAVAALHGPPPSDRRVLADRARIVRSHFRGQYL